MMVGKNDMSGVTLKHSSGSSRQEATGADGAGVSASSAEQVSNWGDLVDQIEEALAVQKPAPSFRRTLKHQLVEMVQGHPKSEVLVAEPATPRELVIGAAIGSAVALAGGIAYLLRLREHTRAQPMVDAQLEQVSTQVS